ncbi:uncharacterized protein [Musca autumnalis]|uniref:uncharacterized protein n=1 Tax=Musca autumnalis TaxID=221902 RepID=UPI003CE78B44
MKVINIILFIGLIFGISSAEVQQKDSYQVMKEMAANMKPMIQGVLKDMPSTSSYRRYKQDWESVLHIYDEHKDNEKCIDKLNRIVQAFGNNIQKLMKRNTTAEEKEMLRLFMQYGFEQFTDKYGQLLRTARDPQYDVVERC